MKVDSFDCVMGLESRITTPVRDVNFGQLRYNPQTQRDAEGRKAVNLRTRRETRATEVRFTIR
jgi:hypothetical protein